MCESLPEEAGKKFLCLEQLGLALGRPVLEPILLLIPGFYLLLWHLVPSLDKEGPQHLVSLLSPSKAENSECLQQAAPAGPVGDFPFPFQKMERSSGLFLAGPGAMLFSPWDSPPRKQPT